MAVILPPPKGGRATLLSVSDYREAAREALSPMTFDYYGGGSRDEATLRENRAAFGRRHLRHRVLRDVSACDSGVEEVTPDLLAR